MSRKHFFPVLLATLALGAATAQARDIASLKAGTLKDAGIDAAETQLTITGEMDASDFFYIFDNLNSLKSLNISGVNIVAYNGSPLPYTGMTRSAAGVLPDYALAGLTSLTDLRLPSSIKVIGKGSLSGSGITTLTVPAGVTEIKDYAMMRCASLQSVSMSDKVTSIGTRAFAYCPKLTTINLSASLTEIPEGLFEACGGLRSLNLDDLASCTEIGPWALAECRGISTLVLPDNAEVLGKCSLYGTASITTLALPAAMAEIHEGAMGGMKYLGTLNAAKVEAVPALGANVWSQVDQPSAVLVAPDAQVDQYAGADQWKEFNIIEASKYQSSTENIEAEVGGSNLTIGIDGSVMTIASSGKALGTVAIYNVGGTQVASAGNCGESVKFKVEGWPKGVYLVVSGAGVAKVTI